jgi:exonuclease III
MVMPQNVLNLKTLCRSRELTQVAKFKHKGTKPEDINNSSSSPLLNSVGNKTNNHISLNKPNQDCIKRKVSKKFSSLAIYHQNIRGINNKTEELLSQWEFNLPHVLCFTEHHLTKLEITCIIIKFYNLEAYFCHKSKNGGVCIFVHYKLQFTPTDLNEYCIDQDIEICAVKLHHFPSNICILTVYRSPTGNVSCFLNNLEFIRTRIYTNLSNIILCGDINVNYLDDGDTNKLTLDSLLASYNLCSTVNFPTRVTNTSATATDNYFIDNHRNEIYSIHSLSNGLSDHDAQVLTLNNLELVNSPNLSVRTRDINEYTKLDFKSNLNCVTWANVFAIEDDVNLMVNNFLNIYLVIFNHSFPYKNISLK